MEVDFQYAKSWPGYTVEGNESANLEETPAAAASEAVFTIIKTWQQPKCPSGDAWMKKIWYRNTQQSIIRP